MGSDDCRRTREEALLRVFARLEAAARTRRGASAPAQDAAVAVSTDAVQATLDEVSSVLRASGVSEARLLEAAAIGRQHSQADEERSRAPKQNWKRVAAVRRCLSLARRGKHEEAESMLRWTAGFRPPELPDPPMAAIDSVLFSEARKLGGDEDANVEEDALHRLSTSVRELMAPNIALPSVHTFTALLKRCAVLKSRPADVSAACALLSMARMSGTGVDSHLRNAFLSVTAAARGSPFAAACALIEYRRGLLPGEESPDAVSLNLLARSQRLERLGGRRITVGRALEIEEDDEDGWLGDDHLDEFHIDGLDNEYEDEDSADSRADGEEDELCQTRTAGVHRMRTSAERLNILDVKLGETACAWAVQEARSRGVNLDSRTLSAVLSALSPSHAIRLLREYAAASHDVLSCAVIDAAARTCIRGGKLALAREAILIGRTANVEEDSRLAETARRCGNG